ncbi:MlaD family protein [Candidatus Venteria ishoeyi]|uniref:Mce related protein n=1 Tax=Candidatus Venteria ishoeyi TaxID=1899563 RepID=A0A1H6FFK4_9GAMM|nr:MlaD family protein [Candidatus Venteria ishoeyi]MDM8545566.1 MlaD family protein [Candidatus Venteria ishoeyi]SEH08858.1 mce related protein [Candidatus Venteria ishoeyi]
MDNKVNYALVGFFVLFLGGAFIFIALWLASDRENKQWLTFQAHFNESVSGLNHNAPVKYRGVEVGKVTGISLLPAQPEKIRVLMRIDAVVPINVDTIATLKTQGITGLAFIELSGSTIEAPRLQAQAGAEYLEIQTGPSLFVRIDTAITDLLLKFETMSNGAETLMQQLKVVSERANQLISTENIQHFSETLQHLDNLGKHLLQHKESLAQVIQAVNQTTKNTQQISENIKQALPGTINQFNQATAMAITGFKNFDRVVLESEQTLLNNQETLQRTLSATARISEQIDSLVKDIKPDLQRVGGETLPGLNSTVLELRTTLVNLNRITQQLQRNPNQLIFGKPMIQPGPGE